MATFGNRRGTLFSAEGVGAQRLTKVKGHATQQHIDEGTATLEQKEGNDWADDFADRGALEHEPVVERMAKWMQKRHHA